MFYRFSRKIVWLKVASTNKNSAVIGHYYVEAIKKQGGKEKLKVKTLSQDILTYIDRSDI